MKHIIDIEQWNRKEHFRFFSQFDEPYFGLTANVDCTLAYQKAKGLQTSFFIYYLFQSLQAANRIEPFRYRMYEGQVVCFDEIHASATMGRADTTFAFSFIPFQKELADFTHLAQQEMEAVKNSSGLRLNEQASRIDTIHYSSIPWISFSSVSHARHFKYPDSVPKITFGKTIQEGRRMLLPVSVHVHHGLMDGYHVGKYFETFQKLLDA